MNADELRSIQAPLKDRYRVEPDAALVTLRASGALDSSSIACKVETRPGARRGRSSSGVRRQRHGALLRRHAARSARRLRGRDAEGGRDIDRRRAAQAGSLAEGDLDFRGTLGVARDAPVGFANIRLRFELDTDAPEAQLETLLKLTERYCVVLQTLRRPPAIEARLARGSSLDADRHAGRPVAMTSSRVTVRSHATAAELHRRWVGWIGRGP